MSLTKLHCDKFTAFDKITLNFSPGINVFVGANGTGKTHLMKIAYAACDITKTKMDFAEKLSRVFLPSGRALGRLVKRQKTSSRGIVEVYRADCKLRLAFSNHAEKAEAAAMNSKSEWMSRPMESVYIPVKEMLSNAPGFRSLYNQRETHFEEIYADILDLAYRPSLRGPMDKARKELRACLTISADSVFIQITWGVKGLNKWSSKGFGVSLRIPTITRSAFSKASKARPSRRFSGEETK